MQHVSKMFIGLSLLTACGPATQISQTQEAWNRKNDPSIMAIDQLNQKYQYETSFAKLPLSGQLAVTPWSDHYWPTYRGGLTYRWAQHGADRKRYIYDTKPFAELSQQEIAVLSPAEKFDLYMGFEDYRTTKAERNRTRVLTKKDIPTWEGLCHAWAPATLAFKEPAAVTLKNKDGVEIPFGSSDVNGLLTMFLDRVDAPRTSFLGGRCGEDLSSLQDKINELQDPAEINKLKAELKEKSEKSECRDTNAGAFHIVLTNQIARMKEGFVVDVTRDDEVWNQAVYGFEIRVDPETTGPSKGAAAGTVKEVTITATMKYIVEVDYHQARGGYRAKDAEESVDYRYRLELDKNDRIIGGEWLSYDRPDFLWKQSTPAFDGVFKGVEEIYKASINH